MRYTESEMRDAILEVAGRTDKHLSMDRYDRLRDDDHPMSRTVTNSLGSWDDVKESLGLSTEYRSQQSTKYPDGGIEYLERARDELGNPTLPEFQEHFDDPPSRLVFEEHFGSWTEAKEAVGIITAPDHIRELIEGDPVVASELPGGCVDARHKQEYNIYKFDISLSPDSCRVGDLPMVYYIPTEHPFRDVIFTFLDNTPRLVEEKSAKYTSKMISGKLSGVRKKVARKAVYKYYDDL